LKSAKAFQPFSELYTATLQRISLPASDDSSNRAGQSSKRRDYEAMSPHLSATPAQPEENEDGGTS
jgi:hypothetical protein